MEVSRHSILLSILSHRHVLLGYSGFRHLDSLVKVIERSSSVLLGALSFVLHEF